jgi:hypothetical protein
MRKEEGTVTLNVQALFFTNSIIYSYERTTAVGRCFVVVDHLFYGLLRHEVETCYYFLLQGMVSVVRGAIARRPASVRRGAGATAAQ